MGAIGVLLCCGVVCSKKEAPPDAARESQEVAQPDAPSPEELAAELEAGLGPLDQLEAWEIDLTQEMRDMLVAYLLEAARDYRQTPQGQAALRLVVGRLDARLAAAREDMNTDLVMLLCDLIEIIEPDNSKLPRYREWASILLARPDVTIRGWFEFGEPRYGDDEIYVLLEVRLPATGEVERVQVREGEEFLGLKFHRIIGKKRGILLEYLATGDRFGVYGPGPRSRVQFGERRR